ncbi:unnamed protein product, partial [marine sediment metagenome]
KDLKLTSRDELSEDRLTTIQDEQQKRKGLEEKLAAKDIEYKKLMIERDELKKERESIYNIISRVADKWKDDAAMMSFEKSIASWKKRPPMLIAFLLENIEKLTHEKASYVVPSFDELEKMAEQPLMYGLAIVNKIRILEPVWNDLLHKALDGEWHAFSEMDELIKKMNGNRGLTIESIRQKRGAYLRFAKDEEYHTARGEKDYLYERKKSEGVHKFRFTIVG